MAVMVSLRCDKERRFHQRRETIFRERVRVRTGRGHKSKGVIVFSP